MNNCKHYDLDCKEEEMGCEGCAYCNNKENEGMQIKTKYRIGDRVWIVYKNETHKEIEIYSDTIEGIYIDNNQKISYAFKCSDDIYEERLIRYEDTQKLIRTIQKFDNEFQEEGEQK